jgi:hypothetical protein
MRPAQDFVALDKRGSRLWSPIDLCRDHYDKLTGARENVEGAALWARQLAAERVLVRSLRSSVGNVGQ